MSDTIYRTEDPALETIEFGAVYQTRAPRTGEPWALHKIADNCGVSSIEPLGVPDWWDDAYEYAMADEAMTRRWGLGVSQTWKGGVWWRRAVMVTLTLTPHSFR